MVANIKYFLAGKSIETFIQANLLLFFFFIKTNLILLGFAALLIDSDIEFFHVEELVGLFFNFDHQLEIIYHVLLSLLLGHRVKLLAGKLTPINLSKEGIESY